MKVVDKKARAIELFHKESKVQKRKSYLKKAEDIKVRDLEEKSKILKARQKAIIRHDEKCDALKEARHQEVINRQAFFKKTALLNII